MYTKACVVGWKVSSRIPVYSEAQNVTLSENRVLEDVIRMRPHWTGVGPKYNDWCPYRKCRGGWERGKTVCEDWGRDWRDTATIHGTAGATSCWTVPWSLGTYANTLVLDFWPPMSCANEFCWCKPLSLWHFVKAATGNSYTVFILYKSTYGVQANIPLWLGG